MVIGVYSWRWWWMWWWLWLSDGNKIVVANAEIITTSEQETVNIFTTVNSAFIAKYDEVTLPLNHTTATKEDDDDDDDDDDDVIASTATTLTNTASVVDTLNLSHSHFSVNHNDIPQIPSYTRITAMCFCLVILVLGVIGNIMVPIVIIRTKDMRNSTNIFLTNLSVADLLVLLVCTPTVLVELNTRPEIWILGSQLCKTVPFVELTVAHASALTILAISFERYYAICKPLKAGYVCTKTRATLICSLAWLVAALFTSPILWVAEYKFINDINGSLVSVCLTQAITDWTIAFFLMIITLFFILPLIILIILYGIIAKNLITNKGPMMRLRPTKPELSLKARNQVILMLGAVVLSFFLCLLPFRLFTLWIIFSTEQNLNGMGMERYYNLLYFCRIMLYLNSAINPILYNLMSTKIRKGFYKLLCSMRSHLMGNCCQQQASPSKRGNVNTAATTATNSNTGTTANTSSSILSRNSNRTSSEEGYSRSQIIGQPTLTASTGKDSEMIAMLHTIGNPTMHQLFASSSPRTNQCNRLRNTKQIRFNLEQVELNA